MKIYKYRDFSNPNEDGLSSERSATSRFNFAFSSRSCLSSRISVLTKFAYFFF